MNTAADVMTKNPMALKTSDTLLSAVQLFLEKGFVSIPVIDDNQAIIGVLTEDSILKAYIWCRGQKIINPPIKVLTQFINKPTVLKRDLNVLQVMKELIASPGSRVLIANERGQLEGIISPKDLIKVLYVSEIVVPAKTAGTDGGVSEKKL